MRIDLTGMQWLPWIGVLAWFALSAWQRIKPAARRIRAENRNAGLTAGRPAEHPGPPPRMTREDIARHRSMPYDQYLQSAWWNWRKRKYAYDHGGWFDELWKGNPGKIVVHHCGPEAYDHRGQERDQDLVMTTASVHSAIHAALKKSGTYTPQKYRRRGTKRRRLTKTRFSW